MTIKKKTNMESNTIRLTIEGGRTFTATLVDNSSTQALKEQLAKGNITVEDIYRHTGGQLINAGIERTACKRKHHRGNGRLCLNGEGRISRHIAPEKRPAHHDRIMLSMFKKHYTNEGVFPRHAAFSCRGIVSLLSLCVFLPAAHPVLLQACAQWHPHTRASLRLRIPGWRAGRPCPG